MALFAALFVASCSTARFEDCATPTCRKEWVERHWDGTPDSILPALRAIPDLDERALLTYHVVELDPSRASPLCGEIPHDVVRDRCITLVSRPHLWSDLPAATSVAPRKGGGQAGPDLLPASARDPFAGRQAAEIDCSRGDPRACYTNAAMAAARRGRKDRVVGACLGNAGDVDRRECLFRAAERMVVAVGPSAYADSVELCLGTGSFAANCLEHLCMQLARGTPPAGRGLPEKWAAIAGVAEVIAGYWAERDPVYAAHARERFWSDVGAGAYGPVMRITGEPFDHLPADAAPQLRAAAAWRFLELGGPDRSLAEWTAALDSALADRSRDVALADPPLPLRGVVDLWPEDLAGEDAVPSAIYLATSRRTWSADPRVDLAISLLEAAARMDPPMTDLVEDGAESDVEAVRWTARRLAERRVDEDPPEARLGSK